MSIYESLKNVGNDRRISGANVYQYLEIRMKGRDDKGVSVRSNHIELLPWHEVRLHEDHGIIEFVSSAEPDTSYFVDVRDVYYAKRHFSETPMKIRR